MSNGATEKVQALHKKPRRSSRGTEDDFKVAKRAKTQDEMPSTSRKDKKETAAKSQLTTKSVLNLEERTFPRGGASVLTPIERKQIQIQADRDALFEEAGKKRPPPQDISDDDDQGDTIAEKAKKKQKEINPSKRRKTRQLDHPNKTEEKADRIEGLSFKKLVPGSLILGQVADITSRDVAISLPNGLTGYVPLMSISRQLSERVEKLLEDADENSESSNSSEFEDIDIKKLFRIGQYVRAAVVSCGETKSGKHKKHIELSLDPRLVNVGLTKDDIVVDSTIQASVISIEDNGLVMDLGIDDVDAKGFIGADDVDVDVKHTDIPEGAVLLCLVTGHGGNGRVVKLSSSTATIGNVKKGKHTLTNSPSVNAYIPGTAASVIVSEVTENGIRGTIMGMVDVTADLVHAGGAEGNINLEEKFKSGSRLQARVLFTYPKNESQRLGISVLEHIVSLSPKSSADQHRTSPLERLPLSSTVEEAKIVKVAPRMGVYLDLGVPGVYAFAHISNLSDKKVDSLSADSGPYKLGTSHRARVIGYSAIDGLFAVSLQESTLSQPFLRVEDVHPGQLVDGTIESLPIKSNGVSGILLQLADGIRGFVPVEHISDTVLKHPERKYRPGMRVKARVLRVNREKQTIYLTMKKTLVGSEIEPWTNYDSLNVGDLAPGFITRLSPSGAWVQFYGDVRAFLPVGEMSEAYIKDPAEHFRLAQVVNVHIVSIDREGRRMIVSCKDPASFSKEREEAFAALEVGQLVDGTVIELAKDLITLELASGIQGHLRVQQLTDGGEKKNAAALAKMRAGMRLQNLTILQKLGGSRAVVLSSKPSIMEAARNGRLLTRFEDLQRKKKVDGFVRGITATGVFVEFGNRIVGLIPETGMPDGMKQLRMQNYGLTVGQSISAMVWNIYADENRFTLTLREEVIPDKVNDSKKPLRAPQAPRELGNPVDPKLATVDDLKIGTQTFARVNAVKELQLNISLADNVHGRIHATEVFKAYEDIENPKAPLQSIKHNATLPVTVIGLHNARTYKFLPFSHRQSVHPVYECSHRQSDTSEPETLSLLKLKEGEERLAFVCKYTGSHALASVSPDIHGIIDVVDLASIETDYQNAFPIGSALQVKVRRIDVEKGKLQLAPTAAPELSKRTFEEGGIYVGRVTRTHADGLDVQLSRHCWGLVPLTELADDYDQADPDRWSVKEAIKVKVLAKQDSEGKFVLSARPSLAGVHTGAAEPKDRHIRGNNDLATCEVIRGFVKKISSQGMLVRLGWNTIAQVPIHELSDEFIKNYAVAFQLRQLVTGKITKVDADGGHHKMSLRKSVLNDPNYQPELGFADINIGDIVDAVVVKVENYGVFIRVVRSKNIRGLCHVKELANTRIEDPSKLYSEGDLVKAKIIKLDKAKRHVNFSLKAVHFQELPEARVDSEEERAVHEMDDAKTGTYPEPVQAEDEESEVEEVNKTLDHAPARKQSLASGLKTGAFNWEGVAGESRQDDAEPEADEYRHTKKRRKAEIQIDKTGDLDSHGPQSVSDFERLLLGQPNSSALWIQYMAFQLGLSEVEKAREVAERALKTIHMREEEEKLNIWIAMLNLENTYGSEESLESVFERACQMSDKKEVNFRLASIYIDSGKHKEAEALFSRMRKSRDISCDPNYWLNYATLLMTTMNRADEARALLQRATQALPAHQHAHLISRFGALEYQSVNGDVERGRTIFEGLIDAHKTGHDLWDQYLAQEISLLQAGKGDVDSVRRLFERMTKLKMRPKRARYVFKRWMSWEKGLVDSGKGSDKMVAKVKELAEQWVANEGQGKQPDA
ncbi:uncharacterized protein PV09_08413 [Verruconis gallopava]|uniref:S1 motif domain-containing protein n=1 Tax=Verruconis gallopava TaxID=253628 RepID=A0A0D2A193_9PEZI|nr:uncharacterized protein PV09_08413 [Verruconis gallopava]KIW00070.1 hypothetical protein PV09_08413 [Verruconis gallopava]